MAKNEVTPKVFLSKLLGSLQQTAPYHILRLRHCNKRNSTQAILQEHATLFQNFS